MARVIIVLATTFCFALLGLLIGYLNMQAHLATAIAGTRISDAQLVNYLLAPFAAGAIGFVLSIVTLRMFGQPE